MKEQFNSMQSQIQTLLSIVSSAGREGKQEIAKKLIATHSFNLGLLIRMFCGIEKECCDRQCQNN
jgi:hypothetical protein